MGNTEPE